MKFIKQIIGKTLKVFLPDKIYRLVANGFIIVPAYYKLFINEAEVNRNYTIEKSDDQTILLGRKYAHILDKGLQCENPEPGHSTAIYKSCLDTIQQLDKTQYSHDPSFLWIKNKVSEYEDLQHGKFVKKNIPSPNFQITFDQISTLIKARRSNRHFKQQPIEISLLKQLLELSNWASSSCNKQPIRIFFTVDPSLSKQCLNQCAGGTCFSNYIPCFLAFCANIRGYEWPSEIMLPYIDVSLGAQNLFLAATTLNLSGCILSWAQKTSSQEKNLREFLEIPQEYQIIFCAVLGYAAINNETPSRKSIYH